MAPVLKLARFAVVCAAALSAAGCGGVSSAGRRSAERAIAAPSVDAGQARFVPLEPQPLVAGQCGLYLWAAGAQQPLFVFVAYDNPAEAHVRPNGRERVLRRTAFSGHPSSGHFEQTTYSDGRLTLSVEISFDEARRMRDGAAIRNGVIRVRDDEGWETILPVGGLVACAPV